MSNRKFCIKSNIAVHGVRWAFDNEVKRFKRMGCSADRAFMLAAVAVFGRYVTA
jgi:hypothetical protein